MVGSFSGKRVLVHGLGLHGGGISVVKWLLKNQAIVKVTDLKTAKQLKKSIDTIHSFKGGHKVMFTLGKHDFKDFENQDLIVQNPGVPAESKYLQHARKNNIPIVNEAVMFFGLFDGPIVAVTGTRGKSTTSVLLHKILRTKINHHIIAGNIAKTPMLDVVDKLKKNSLPVLELSSWHLEKLFDYQKSPHVAIVTNVMRDHLNRYKSFAHYKQAKFAITAHQTAKDFVVLNADNTDAASFAKKTKAKVYFFSVNKKIRGCFVRNKSIYFNDGKKVSLVMPVSSLHLPGQHNLANTLAAITAAKILGITNANIERAIKNFKGVFYRLEYKGRISGIEIFNDSTSTNPDATIAAIKALADKPIVLIAGGMNKGLSYDQMASVIRQHDVYTVLMPGSATDLMASAFKKIGYKNFERQKTLTTAWKKAWHIARAEQRIVFSPGAASFNMFINEFDRARKFDKLINDQKKRQE